jgi:hypothetical protein
MEGKMKNHLFMLATMALIMLFVVSLSEAQVATFHIVDPEGADTVHPPGDIFDIEFYVDTTDFIPGSDDLFSVQFLVQMTTDEGIIVPTNTDNPFTVIETTLGTTDANDYSDVEDTLTLQIRRGFADPGPSVGENILIATVNFESISGDLVNLSYQNKGLAGGTNYRLGSATGTIQDPDIEPIDIPLPASLSAFTAVPADKDVMIKWSTASELNNLGFDVYRSESLDGTFAKVNLTRIQGAGTDATPNHYNFLDESVEVGKTYYYYLEDVSYSGMRGRSDIIKVTVDLTGKLKVVGLAPPKFALLQNFPNPFNPETWIPFKLGQASSVTVRIYNLKGQPIRTLELGQKEAGTYLTKDKAVYWDGRDNVGEKVASGMYFYMLKAGEFTSTRRMVIIQ